MIGPERAAARKAAEKLNSGTEAAAGVPAGAPPPSGLTSDGLLRSRQNKKQRRDSSSSPERDSSQDKASDFGLVPQRKAAKRATAQLKDADRIGSNKEENMLLFGGKDKVRLHVFI